jgi:chaperonin GroES
MNIRPLHDRIIVERLEEETTTASGIIIPDSAKEKPILDVKVGDKVLFGKYSGTEIKIEGKEYLMMREDDVLGVVE